MHDGLRPEEADGAAALLAELNRLEAVLTELASGDREAHAKVTARLETMSRRARDAGSGVTDEPVGGLVTESDDELFAVLNKELGLS